MSNVWNKLKKHFAAMILTALAFVVALVWKDFLVEGMLPLVSSNGIWGLLGTAILVTLLGLIAVYFIGNMFEKEKQQCLNHGGKWENNDCLLRIKK